MAEQVTLEQLAPYLTERGRLECAYAEQSWKVALLVAEVDRLRAEAGDDDGTDGG